MGAFTISKRYGLTASQRRDLSDRVDSILDGFDKEASGLGTAFIAALGASAAGAAVSYGVPAAVTAMREARVRADRDRLIEMMSRAHPEIRNFSRREVDLVYNSLSMHSPRVLEDPLLGGQLMLDALRRGNYMDVGQLSNISKLTGGSGLKEHESEAVRVLGTGMTQGPVIQYYQNRANDKKPASSAVTAPPATPRGGSGGRRP
ncbi:MAG: hypothetical protein ACO32I_02715 [Candidatus Limnocylindrus sp.]